MTKLWHLYRTASQVFSKSGMNGRICGKQKQRLKTVTGSALISMSWENAREFSSIVRSLQEVISFPINYVPCRSSRPLQCERPSLLSYVCVQNDQNISERQRGESSSQWCTCPLISLTKNNGYLITRVSSVQRWRKITIIPRHVLLCD